MASVIFCGENLLWRSGVSLTSAGWESNAPAAHAATILNPSVRAQTRPGTAQPYVYAQLPRPLLWDVALLGYGDFTPHRGLIANNNTSTTYAYTQLTDNGISTDGTLPQAPFDCDILQATEIAVSAEHYAQVTYTKDASLGRTASLKVGIYRDTGDRRYRVLLGDGAGNSGYADFDLSDTSGPTATGTAGTGFSGLSGTITAEGSWFVLTLSATINAGASLVGRLQVLTSASVATFTGDVGVDFYWQGLHLEFGASASPWVTTGAEPGGVWRLRAGRTAAQLTASTPLDSGLLPIAAGNGDQSHLGWITAFYKAAAVQSMEFVRWDIYDDDGTNNTAKLIGAIGLYKAFQPARTIDSGWQSNVTEDPQEVSIPGGVGPVRSIEAKGRDHILTLDWLTEAEAREARTIEEWCGKSRPVLVVYDPDDDGPDRQRRTVLGTIESAGAMHRTYSVDVGGHVYRREYRINGYRI